MQILIAVDLSRDFTTRNKVMVQTSDGLHEVGYVHAVTRDYSVFERVVKMKLELVITDHAYLEQPRGIEDTSVATATLVRPRLGHDDA